MEFVNFIFSLDVLATVLEEMPPFPEKESSGLLNLLKKKRPGRVPENPGSLDGHKAEKVNGAHGAQSGISLPDANEQVRNVRIIQHNHCLAPAADLPRFMISRKPCPICHLLRCSLNFRRVAQQIY